MAEATFVHGDPLMVDYTPSGDVTAGDVVVIGVIPYVAHVDIPAGVKGAVAARGGVYGGIAAGNYAPGAKIYWDASEGEFTTATGEHPHFGFIVPSSDPAADQSPVVVEHCPDGSATASS